MIGGTNSRFVRLVAFCLTLTPAALLAVLITQYSVDFPQWDQWDYVKFFQKLSLHTLTFADLFAQVNEYRQFFPNLVFVALGRLTRWDQRYEMWALFLLACLIAFNVYRLARLTFKGDHRWRVLLLFIANLLIFSPVQYPNWLQGQQLEYYVPIACVTTCILVAHSRLRPSARFLICACLAAISTFSSANGVVCWIVVLPVLLIASLDRIPARGWLVAAWIAGLFSSAALYLHGYHKPGWSPSPLTAFSSPVRALVYFLIFIGGPLGLERGPVGTFMGVLLLALFAVACFLVVRFRDDETFVRRVTPWLMVGAYSILTGVMTTIGRVGLGINQSIITTRYIGYSVYLVVSLVFLMPLIREKLSREAAFLNPRRLTQLTAGAAVALLLWQPLMLVKGIAGMREMRLKLLQAKASVLLINYVPDPELVHNLYPNLSFLAAQANILDKLGYLRPGLVRSNKLQDFEGDRTWGNVYGSLDKAEMHDNSYAVSGVATLPYRREAPDAVLLAYEQTNGDCIVFGLTHPKLSTSESRNPFTRRSDSQPWDFSGPVDRLPSRPAKLTAWAFDANTARAYRLAGSYVIP